MQLAILARPARLPVLLLATTFFGTCGAGGQSGQLVDACSYSFADLFQASRLANNLPAAPPALLKATLANLYAQKRDEINDQVQEWATAAGWYTEMQIGSDGGHFLAFSPEVKSGVQPPLNVADKPAANHRKPSKYWKPVILD